MNFANSTLIHRSQSNGSVSNTTLDGTNECVDLPSYLKTPLHATLIISLFLGVVGNSVICLIVARHYQLHTVTNAHIVNMAIGHLLFSIFCVPLYLSIVSKRQVSKWLCSTHGFFFTLFAAGSTLALVLIAFERYHVITKANKNKLSAKTTKKMILATWLMALAFSVPWTLVNDGQNACTSLSNINHSNVLRLNDCLPFLKPPASKSSQIVYLCLVILCFILPLATAGAFYCRMAGPIWKGYNQVRPLGAGHPKTIRYTAEIRTARTMLVIFVLFLCCWASYYFIAIINVFNWPFKQTTNEAVTIISICLAFCSFSFDPLIYALRNPRFSIIFRGRNRRREKTKVKFSTGKLPSDDATGSNENISKWARARCITSVFETTSRSGEELRATSTAQTVSTRMSGSTLSFSYHVGTEESHT